MRIGFNLFNKISSIKLRIPALMTLEAAVIVPVFFLIVYGSVGISVSMYEEIEMSANEITANNEIDAVKNFRYINIGQDLVSLGKGGEK